MRRILVVAGAAVLLAGFSSFGLAAEPNPTVKNFIATCSKVRHIRHQKDSDAYVGCTGTMMFAELQPGYCAPPELTQPDDIRLATIKWLKQRPDMFSMNDTSGILVALKAMYCH